MIETPDVIAHKISLFIVDSMLLGKPVDLVKTPSLLEAGVIDSTGVLELVQFLEDTWDFQIVDDEMVPENLDSLQALTGFVLKKTKARTPVAA